MNYNVNNSFVERVAVTCIGLGCVQVNFANVVTFDETKGSFSVIWEHTINNGTKTKIVLFVPEAQTPSLPLPDFEVVINSADSTLADTQAMISEFLLNRANQMLQNAPDIARFFGDKIGNSGAPVDLVASMLPDQMSLAFSTSLMRLLNTPGDRSVRSFTAQTEDTTARFFDEPYQDSNYDVWMELYGSSSDSGYYENKTWLAYVGAHYFISNDLILGGLLQIDWAKMEDKINNGRVSGTGWMFGPYLATRFLNGKLLLEARAAGGKSNNSINPTGAYKDEFDTVRWLVSGKLSGSIALAALTIGPQVRLAWFQETQGDYVDGLGNPIPSQTVSLGEVRFGSSLSYDLAIESDFVVQPKIGVYGVWNFDVSGSALSQGSVIDGRDLRLRLDGGLDVRISRRWGLTGEVFFDGVGVSDYQSYGGKIGLDVLLN